MLGLDKLKNANRNFGCAIGQNSEGQKIGILVSKFVGEVVVWGSVGEIILPRDERILDKMFCEASHKFRKKG